MPESVSPISAAAGSGNMMAADGERRDACAASKQEQSRSQISRHARQKEAFRDSVASILESLAELGAKVCLKAH